MSTYLSLSRVATVGPMLWCVLGLGLAQGCGTLSDLSELCLDTDPSQCPDEDISWQSPTATSTDEPNAATPGSSTTTPPQVGAGSGDHTIAPDDTDTTDTTDDVSDVPHGDDDGGQIFPTPVPVPSCERRGFFETAQAGRLNGVVALSFPRPTNLRSDWANLLLLVENVPTPFVVNADDGETVELLVYLTAVSGTSTRWIANACHDETIHGPRPNEVWSYQLAPADPAAVEWNSVGATGFHITCGEEDTSSTPPSYGCAQSMLPGAGGEAWTMVLRSRADCNATEAAGNWAVIAQTLDLPAGDYRVRGAFGALAQLHSACENELAAEASLSFADTETTNGDEQAMVQIARQQFLGTFECYEQRREETPFDAVVSLTSNPRLRLTMQSGECADATTSVTDLRLYRLPDLSVESHVDEDATSQ